MKWGLKWCYGLEFNGCATNRRISGKLRDIVGQPVKPRRSFINLLIRKIPMACQNFRVMVRSLTWNLYTGMAWRSGSEGLENVTLKGFSPSDIRLSRVWASDSTKRY